MNHSSFFASAVIVFLVSQNSVTAPCLQWKNPERVGTLDDRLSEASGMDISKQFPGRVYHINDSGSKGEFLVTGMDGRLQERVSIKNFKPVDTEDLSLGPCGAETCLFIADTGDNQRERKTSTIIAITEKKSFNGKAEIATRFTIKYPDGKAHDVESLAIHPNGSLFVVTKDYDKKADRAEVAQIYWLPTAELWKNPRATKTLYAFGELDIAKIIGNHSAESLVTSMTIHSSGERFALLTYSKIIEFYFDISKGLKKDLTPADYTVLPTRVLLQQEAVAYATDQDALIYTTEDEEAPIYQVQCSQR